MTRIAPAMSDGGRSFTNFVSSGLYEQMMQQKFGITGELQYRMFLQRNGGLIADESRKLRVTRFRPGR